MECWISYAGSDGSDLVESIVAELVKQESKLEILRYRKMSEFADDAVTPPGGTAIESSEWPDWPVSEPPAGTDESKDSHHYHLLPMERIVDLVLAIADCPRVLVVLSPAYFNSTPCLQELAALLLSERRPTPVVVLNGIDHSSFLDDATVSAYVNKLLDAHKKSNVSDDMGFIDVDKKEVLTDKLKKWIEGNLVSDQRECKVLCEELDKKLCTISNSWSSGADGLDRKRCISWLERGLGKRFLQVLSEVDQETHSAGWFADRILLDSLETETLVCETLDKIHQDGDWKKADLKIMISELAGLFALTLIDVESFALNVNRNPKDRGFWFINFKTDERHQEFKAMVANASLQDSLLRLTPATGAGLAPQGQVHEVVPKPAAATASETAERQFVEKLYSVCAAKPASKLIKNDLNHVTCLDAETREDLRGRVRRYQRLMGRGVFSLQIRQEQFDTGSQWWATSWQELHDAINDGAAAADRIHVPGIVIGTGQHNTLQFHDAYQDRLTVIRLILEKYPK